MACCKVCCGCQDCAEGQEGKCCCGGQSGACCQAGQYCCSGVCQGAPCGGGACCLPATCCIEGSIDWGDTPSESWGTPPGWVWIGVLDPDNSPSNVSYSLCIPDTAETPCDINATHWQAEIAALIAWAQDQGLPSENVAWSVVSSVAASCEAAESQLACEGQGGTFYAGQTCEDNPCGCCCGVDGSAQSQSSVECEAAGSTFIEGSCDLECVSAGSGQPYPDCVNQFVVNCSNACSRVPDNDSNHAQCTCATVNSISEFNDCVDGFAAALVQQGWDAVSYDSFTSSGTSCAIQWSRDIVACCSGEIDYENAILAESPFSSGLLEPSTPCPCMVISGGYEDVDGIYVYQCNNAFP